MSRDSITWLHLSDLHFSKSWKENVVLKTMVDDLQALVETGNKPDIVLVSGDVASSGKPDEYELAQDFFDKILTILKLPKVRLFLTPGNHDVNRGDISIGARAMAKEIASKESKGDFRKSLQAVVQSKDDRTLLLKRLRNYRQFVDSYMGHLDYDETRFVWTQLLDLAGIRVAIIGLNSAWLCYGGKEDRNKIALGEHQVRAALDAVQDADLRIALSHHPFEWLHDLDRRDVEPLLSQACDFILHGHLHHPIVGLITTPDTSAMVIGAGASYEEREKTNAYNLVQLNLKNRSGKIVLRRYSDESGGFWTKDVQTYRNISTGETLFPLPANLLEKWSAECQKQKAEDESKNDLSQWPKFDSEVDPNSLISTRIDHLEVKLRDIVKGLRISNLHHPIIGKLSSQAHHLIKQLDELQKVLERLPSPWTVLLTIEKQIEDLSGDFLDFRTGSMLNASAKEICGWVDLLLGEIGFYTGEGWRGTCILASKSSGGKNSHLVRMPFTHEGIWSLPPTIQQYVGLLQIVDRLAALVSTAELEMTPKDLTTSLQLTVDMLAVYLTGPSYAFAFAVLQFDPVRLSEMQRSLVDEIRFTGIVQALVKHKDLYSPEVELLKKIWERKRPRDSELGMVSEARVEGLHAYAERLYEEFVKCLYPVDHTAHKAHAKYIVECYENGTSPRESTIGNSKLIDTLNAAWYSRMLSKSPDELSAATKFYTYLFRQQCKNR